MTESETPTTPNEEEEMATTRRTVSEAARLDTEKEIKRRDEALAKINTEEKAWLRPIYEAERDAYARQVEDNLLFYWDRGRAGTEVKRNGKYGQGDIDLLADALMVNRTTVYKAITVFAMYPERSALQAKMEEAISKGCKLTWSHMNLIVHVPEAKSGADIHSKRHQMVQLVIDNGLTVRATQDEIMSRYRDDPQGEDRDAGGAPVSLGGVLKRVASFSEKSLERLTESFDTITDRLHQTTGDKVKDDVITTMTADAEALKRLGDKARELSTTLEREATRLRREKATAAEKPQGNGKKPAQKAGSRTPGRARAAS